MANQTGNKTYESLTDASSLSPAQRVCDAARHLYDAECALHIAHQTGVDFWISAASDRLHDAVLELNEAERLLEAAESRRPAA